MSQLRCFPQLAGLGQLKRITKDAVLMTDQKNRQDARPGRPRNSFCLKVTALDLKRLVRKANRLGLQGKALPGFAYDSDAQALLIGPVLEGEERPLPADDQAMDHREIGRKIRQLRAKRRWTTMAMAKKLGMSQAQVSRLENGLQAFRSATLIKIARTLGVPPASLMTSGPGDDSSKVAAELERAGLMPSECLISALKDKGFMTFMERCSKGMRAHKMNLCRMERALNSIT